MTVAQPPVHVSMVTPDDTFQINGIEGLAGLFNLALLAKNQSIFRASSIK
jgi:hypothetical protein